MALLLSKHSNSAFIAGAGALAFATFAESGGVSLIPLVLLLTTLLTYSQQITLRSRVLHPLLLWPTLSLALFLANLLSSLSTLSSAGQSIAALGSLSVGTSFITLLVVYGEAALRHRFENSITLFPAVWASSWWFVSTYLSPFGRLIAWSPVGDYGYYNWISPYVGPVGIDWIVAAWAVILSQAIRTQLASSPDRTADDFEPLIHHDIPEYAVAAQTESRPMLRSRQVLLGAAALTVLAGPSFFSNTLPLSPLSSDATPLTVGCVLPPPLPNHAALSLDDYIREGRKMTSADIVLWPEGAVRFGSDEERDDAFEKIVANMGKTYIGVAFEQPIPLNSPDRRGRAGLKRNGLAVISGPISNSSSARFELYLEYYKQHLVPIAESFSSSPSNVPAKIHTLDLNLPGRKKRPGWPRRLLVTASICFDFAWSSAFSELESRPGLILAPAQTWHQSIGLQMWEQAKSRAREADSLLLWCDGGQGGVSGIVGEGISDVTQVGQGSWMRTVAVQWPFDDRRTVYTRMGNGFLLLIMWAMVAGGLGQEMVLSRILGIYGNSSLVITPTKRIIQRAREVIEGWRPQRAITQQGQTERGEQENLMD